MGHTNIKRTLDSVYLFNKTKYMRGFLSNFLSISYIELVHRTLNIQVISNSFSFRLSTKKLKTEIMK